MTSLKSIALCLMATVSFNAYSNEQKPQQGIQPMDFNQPKTLCLGRIEIDVPKETKVIVDDFNYNGAAYSINTDIKSYSEFQQFVSKRIQALKSEPHDTEGTLLSREMVGPTQMAGRQNSHVIVFRSAPTNKNLYHIESYLYIRPGTMLVLVSGASTDLLDSALKRVTYNLKNTHVRSAENKNQPGYCWGDFFIFDDMSSNNVWGGGHLYFDFPSYPRVHIVLEHRIRLESDGSLIQRIKEANKGVPLIAKALFKTDIIREEKKTIHGFAGEEMMQYISRRGHFERGYEDGAWAYLGDVNNYNDPFIQLSLESAQLVNEDIPLQSTTSQKQVFRLFDFIRNSIRFSEPNQKLVDAGK